MSEKIEISPEQLDALTEIFNIGLGRAGSVLGDMTKVRVNLKIPEVSYIDFKEGY